MYCGGSCRKVNRGRGGNRRQSGQVKRCSVQTQKKVGGKVNFLDYFVEELSQKLSIENAYLRDLIMKMDFRQNCDFADLSSVKADGSNPLLTEFKNLKLRLNNHTVLENKTFDDGLLSKVNGKMEDILHMFENYHGGENAIVEIEEVMDAENFDSSNSQNKMEVKKDNLIKLSSTVGIPLDYCNERKTGESQIVKNLFNLRDSSNLNGSNSGEDTVTQKVKMKFKEKLEKPQWTNYWYSCFGMSFIILFLFGVGYFHSLKISKNYSKTPSIWYSKNFGNLFPDLGFSKHSEKYCCFKSRPEVNKNIFGFSEMNYPGIETDQKWTRVTVTCSKSISEHDLPGFFQLQILLVCFYCVVLIVTKILLPYAYQKYFDMIHMLFKWLIPKQKLKKPVIKKQIRAVDKDCGISTRSKSAPPKVKIFENCEAASSQLKVWNENLINFKAKAIRKSSLNLLHGKVTAEINQNYSEFITAKAFIPGYVNGQLVTVLLDCGAGISLVTSKFLKFMGIKKVNDFSINLAGVATNNISTSGQAKVNLQIGGTENTVFINILHSNETTNYDILLGWDLFDKYPAYRIDAANQIIEMGNIRAEINIAGEFEEKLLNHKAAITPKAKIVREKFVKISQDASTAEAYQITGQNGKVSMIKVKKNNATAEMNMLSIGDNHSKISFFDGSPKESFSEWIYKLKLILLSGPFPPNDEQKLAFLLLHLEGKAESAYKAMNADDKSDFNKVVAHLQKEFPDDGVKKHAEKELLKCFQETGENVHSFSNRLSKIIYSMLDGESSELIEKYLHRELLARLKPELQLKVRKEEPETYEKSIKIATKLEDYLAVKNEFKKSKSSKAENSDTVMAQHFQISGNIRRCYNCKELGHEKIDCTYPLRSRSKAYVDVSQRRCFNCQEIGHEKVDCQNPSRPRSNNFAKINPNNYPYPPFLPGIPNWYQYQQTAYPPNPYFCQPFNSAQQYYNLFPQRLPQQVQQPQITDSEYFENENAGTSSADYNRFDAESPPTQRSIKSSQQQNLNGHGKSLAREGNGMLPYPYATELRPL